MTRKIYWGIAILIVLLIGVSAVLLMRTTDTEPKNVYKGDVEPSQEVVKRVDKEQTTKPSGHYHADGTWHEGTHAEHANIPDLPVSEKVIYPHQKLLDTHPVAALRAQARDRGHWSEKYILPFPPDDVEANQLARALYIYIDHFNIKGFTDDDPETRMPAIRAARHYIDEVYGAAREVYLDKAEGPGGIDVRKIDPRFYDLWKLTLADQDSTRLSESKLLRMPSSFNNQGGSQ